MDFCAPLNHGGSAARRSVLLYYLLGLGSVEASFDLEDSWCQLLGLGGLIGLQGSGFKAYLKITCHYTPK